MTNTQKFEIKQMRRQGIGYGSIAKALNLSSNTVASYCRRNNLTSSCGVIGTETGRDSDVSCAKNIFEIKSGNTVFIITKEYKKDATDTLKDRLETLIVDEARKEFRSCYFVQEKSP